jgi:integrase
MKTQNITKFYDLKWAKDPSKKQSIRLRFRINGVKYTYYPGITILPKYWNDDKKKVKDNVGFIEATLINKKLNNLTTIFDEALHHLQITEQPITPESIKEELDLRTGKKEKKTGNFWAFVEHFIEYRTGWVNPDTGTETSPETIRKYKDCKRIFKEFEVSDGCKMRFDNLNKEWFDRFNQWCVGKNYSVNTIDKITECLRTWMNEAVRQGETTNLDYKQIKTRPQDSKAIYLTDDEIEQIYKVQLTGAYDNARDLFLLGCYTGFRYSDTTTIEKKHINKKKEQITIYQKKTGEPVTIPIMYPELLDILEKRNWSPPYPISNQKLNEYIKEVCKEAKINDPSEKQIVRAGKRIKQFFPKWKLVTSHTARRSFATNLYRDGIAPQTIMKLTGHRTLQAFMAYIRLSDSEHHDIVKKHIQEKKKLKAETLEKQAEQG